MDHVSWVLIELKQRKKTWSQAMRGKNALLESFLVETGHKLLIATAKRGLANIFLGNNIFFLSYKCKNRQLDASLSETCEAHR